MHLPAGKSQMVRPEEADAGVGEIGHSLKHSIKGLLGATDPFVALVTLQISANTRRRTRSPVHTGTSGCPLEKRGATLVPFVVVEDIRDPAVTATFPDHPYDLVVLMGSPWSVYEDRVQGWMRPELEFIRRRLAAGVPMLGICFGAQAMSAALGGEVSHATRPEYGWTNVGSNTEQIADGPWFQFHHDEFTVPEGAVELARERVRGPVLSHRPEPRRPISSRDVRQPARLMVPGGGWRPGVDRGGS